LELAVAASACIRQSGCSLGDDGRRGWAEVGADVIAPPPGELFSETNENSVAILLTNGTTHILLASDAEAREEEYMANGPYTRP
jgi:competence protein ComEC